jgi:hypothetical protein
MSGKSTDTSRVREGARLRVRLGYFRYWRFI